MSARVALAGLLVFMTAAPVSAQSEDVFERVAEMRRRGEDLPAARVLEGERQRSPSPRVSAELGLAYQGAGRSVDAERHLVAATRAEGDAWVDEHRAGLEVALRYVRASLGWAVVECAVGGEVRIVGGEGDPTGCGEPLRVGAGEQLIEVRAPGRQSVRRTVEVSASERATVSVSLEAAECSEPGREHMGGADGECCWPGQDWVHGSCSGRPICPAGYQGTADACVSPGEESASTPRLASFRLGLFGGLTNFVQNDTALFRPGVSGNGRSTAFGPRAELRVGFRLGGPVGLEIIAGGAQQDVSRWLDCPEGAATCVESAPTAYTVDAGLMLQFHTNPPRDGGNVDFHLGVGARPFARIFLDDGVDDTATLTAAVVPVEFGVSVFFASFLSLDVVGQAELWLPWEYCGTGADGASFCAGVDLANYEFAWSGLAGLTLHVD